MELLGSISALGWVLIAGFLFGLTQVPYWLRKLAARMKPDDNSLHAQLQRQPQPGDDPPHLNPNAPRPRDNDDFQ